MSYILNTPSQIKEMLKVIGVSSLDELFSHLPLSIRLRKNLSIPSGLSEDKTIEAVKKIARKNRPLSEFNSFLGAGIYPHYIPSTLKHLLNRTEFYTAYTPYQPEVSQGILQAIFEYQTYICILTGMDVTNASLYDGATALVEAVLMSLRINKKEKVLVAATLHPEYRETLNTYLRGFDFQIEEVPFDREGFLDLDILKDKLDNGTSSLALQNPNFFGLIEDVEKVSKLTKSKDAILIQVTNPVSLAILREPRCVGVDIVCGEGQVLGSSLSFGGPGFGFLATKKDYVRQLPGRIVGQTKDREGKVGFCLTLQAREQHIRREKATSNICSNHSLNAIGASLYLALLGPQGLREVAIYSLNLTHYLYQRLHELEGIHFPFGDRFFNEFVWQIDGSKDVIEELYRKNIIPGLNLRRFYPQLPDAILSSCTETKNKEEIEEFVASLKQILGDRKLIQKSLKS
jgi:glycine dehydrogenase subunit 1